MKNKISNELAIAVLQKKVERLEKKFEEFMEQWGPDVHYKFKGVKSNETCDAICTN